MLFERLDFSLVFVAAGHVVRPEKRQHGAFEMFLEFSALLAMEVFAKCYIREDLLTVTKPLE